MAEKTKIQFDVSIETLLPATLKYRVWAETPEQAAEQIKKLNPTQVQYRLAGRRDRKLTVYQAYTSIVQLVKNLFR
jgi:hypothetical protein